MVGLLFPGLAKSARPGAPPGDQKDVLHLERHQVFEAFEEALGVDDGVGGVDYGHCSICTLSS